MGSNYRYWIIWGQISSSGYFEVEFQIRVISGSNFKFRVFWGQISELGYFGVKFQFRKRNQIIYQNDANDVNFSKCVVSRSPEVKLLPNSIKIDFSA